MKWIDRTFAFDFPESVYPGLIERLRRTPDRLADLVGRLPRELLVRREGETWSIQENAGHLIDVETLFEGRLLDYHDGAATLRPAEMTGRRTFEAQYNQEDVASILARFRKRREAYVARLDALEPGKFGQTAWHPRLNKPMRLCDMLHFQAEHDEHHLRRIEDLIDRFRS